MENNIFPKLTFLESQYHIFHNNKKTSPKKRNKTENKKNIIDTICYYKDEKTFILFEYKNNATVTDNALGQVSNYLNILKSNKDDSQWKLVRKFYTEKKLPTLDKEFYKWDLLKGVCVSSDFTDGQLGLVDDLSLFVMWVERYKNDCWIIEKDSEIEWLKTGEKTELSKPKISPVDREPPKWVEKLEKWINEEVKSLVNEYSFEIGKTSNKAYNVPPSHKISFLTIAYKNPFNSRVYLLTPKLYLVKPSKNLIDQFSLQKKEGSNYYYEIIDKKGNENFQKAFNLINFYLQEKRESNNHLC